MPTDNLQLPASTFTDSVPSIPPTQAALSPVKAQDVDKPDLPPPLLQHPSLEPPPVPGQGTAPNPLQSAPTAHETQPRRSARIQTNNAIAPQPSRLD